MLSKLAVALVTIVLPGLSLANTPKLDAKTCKDWSVTQVYAGKTTQGKLAACWDGESSFRSKSCLDEKCFAYEKMKELGSISQDPRPSKSVGTLGFHLCHRIGGSPEILKITNGKDVRTVDRCEFMKDGSFIETTALVERWQSLREPSN